MLTFFITLLTILEVVVCLLLTLLILMQRPRQEGLGAAFGSGVTDQMFGAQTTNVLQKGTVYLGVMLFGLTFILAILVSKQNHNAKAKASLVRPEDKPVKVEEPAPASAAEKNTPAADEKKDEKKDEKAAAPAPDAPKAPDTKPAEAKPAEDKGAAPTAPADKKPDAAAAPAPAGSTPAPAPVPTTPPTPPEPPK